MIPMHLQIPHSTESVAALVDKDQCANTGVIMHLKPEANEIFTLKAKMIVMLCASLFQLFQALHATETKKKNL